MKEEEDATRVKGTASFDMKPSQEFILKSTDQRTTLSQLQDLVKRFGGETLNAEGNKLLVSLPDSSLPGLQKKLEKVNSSAKTRRRVLFREIPGGVLEESGGKGREAEEKDKETSRLGVAKEGRIIIRIVLVEE